MNALEEKTEYGKIIYKGNTGITYEYQCDKCGQLFEVRRSANDNRPIRCIYCDNRRTHVVIGTCRFHLKGRGFPSKEIKMDQEIAKQDEIMREGFRSQSEIETAKAMLKEREERLVKKGIKLLPDASVREKEIVDQKVQVLPQQREMLERQIHQAKGVQKKFLRRQQDHMDRIDGTIVKKERTKALGKDVLRDACKKQRKMAKV